MKLGLITDIHEDVEKLRTELGHFRDAQVDQVVVIGDVFETGQRIEETCRLLAEARAIGVWGNHDFGLCFDPHPDVCNKYPASVIDFMGSLRPRLEIDGCLFTHVEPWLDPESLADLWYFDGPPDEESNLERIFRAAPNRIMLSGHYHRWLLVTPEGVTDWNGERPIRLNHGRYFVVIGAVCQGSFAIFDTGTSELQPFNAPADARKRKVSAVTERLILRHFESDDGDAMDCVFGDAEVMHFGCGVQTQQWVREWLGRRLEDYQMLGYGLLAVVEKSSSVVIGYCGLTHFPNIAGQPEIEIGYRLARRYWGRGYATEAATAVRDYAFESLNLQRLIALIDSANVASIRVAEKIGLRYEKDVMLDGYSHPDRVYAASGYPTEKAVGRRMIL